MADLWVAGRSGRYALSPVLPRSETELLEESLQSLGLHRTRATNWDLLWHDGSVLPEWTYASLNAGQRINHFPGIGELTFKQRLAENLADVSSTEESDRIIPATYCLPRQRERFLADLGRAPERRWILKPANASEGTGVSLLEDPRAVPARGAWVVQQYIPDPWLWRDCKFHLRLFMLVTGFDPLVVYLHEEGQALGASRPYRGPDRDLGDPYVHITNLSVQHGRRDIPDSEYITHIRQMREYMQRQGQDFDAVWLEIRRLARRLMLAVGPKIRPAVEAHVPYRWNCFGLFGLDILLDSRLKPWLLECNLSPSLTVYAPERRPLYNRLITDVLRLVGIDQPATVDDSMGAEMDRQLRLRGGFQRIMPAIELSPG